jgi:hypothetical protein
VPRAAPSGDGQKAAAWHCQAWNNTPASSWAEWATLASHKEHSQPPQLRSYGPAPIASPPPAPRSALQASRLRCCPASWMCSSSASSCASSAVRVGQSERPWRSSCRGCWMQRWSTRLASQLHCTARPAWRGPRAAAAAAPPRRSPHITAVACRTDWNEVPIAHRRPDGTMQGVVSDAAATLPVTLTCALSRM